MRRRSPQEKKALSYARDRRNAYGENDKSSRTSIRYRKRLPHRADRRREHQTLDRATGALVDGLGAAAQEALQGKLPKRRAFWFAKRPDIPLAEHVVDRLRARLGDDPGRTAERVDRVHRHHRAARGHDQLGHVGARSRVVERERSRAGAR